METDVCDGCERVMPLDELKTVFRRERRLVCIDNESCWALQEERRQVARHKSRVAQALQQHHNAVARGRIVGGPAIAGEMRLFRHRG
jgi:hypothetical protein